MRANFDFDAYDNPALLAFSPFDISSSTRDSDYESFEKDIDSRGLETEYKFNIQFNPLDDFVAQMRLEDPADILSTYPSSAGSASAVFDSHTSCYGPGSVSDYAEQWSLDAPGHYAQLERGNTLAQEIGGTTQLSPIIPVAQHPQESEHPPRRFKCDFCQRAFTRRYNMQKHRETHDPNRERPFVCTDPACQRPFSRKHDLSRHMATRHRGDRLPRDGSSFPGRNSGVERVSKNWGPAPVSVQQPEDNIEIDEEY